MDNIVQIDEKQIKNDVTIIARSSCDNDGISRLSTSIYVEII